MADDLKLRKQQALERLKEATRRPCLDVWINVLKEAEDAGLLPYQTKECRSLIEEGRRTKEAVRQLERLIADVGQRKAMPAVFDYALRVIPNVGLVAEELLDIRKRFAPVRISAELRHASEACAESFSPRLAIKAIEEAEELGLDVSQAREELLDVRKRFVQARISAELRCASEASAESFTPTLAIRAIEEAEELGLDVSQAREELLDVRKRFVQARISAELRHASEASAEGFTPRLAIEAIEEAEELGLDLSQAREELLDVRKRFAQERISAELRRTLEAPAESFAPSLEHTINAIDEAEELWPRSTAEADVLRASPAWIEGARSLAAEIASGLARHLGAPRRSEQGRLLGLLALGARLGLVAAELARARRAVDEVSLPAECAVCYSEENDAYPRPCCGRQAGGNVMCDDCLAKLLHLRCPFCRASF